MSDIFISYKREEQDKARQLADALEKHGWTVWWDPKLRAGEFFDDVIEKALSDARCVIVMWSKHSIQSDYVKAEASYALENGKLVPVAIEDVKLPFRFRVIQTPQLYDWDGSEKFHVFKSLVDGISTKLGQPTTVKPGHVTSAGAWKDWEKGTDFQDMLEDGSKGPEMVFIEGGQSYMGSDPKVDSRARGDEQPRHKVTIEAFYIGKYEVTFAEYDAFALASSRERPNDNGWGRGRRPVIDVSWEHAMAYTEWLSEQTGKYYTLPSEAEWEYAARAGAETRWHWGDNEEAAGDYAWFDTNSDVRTRVVGNKLANGFGLYDMAGNVLEWTEDCWHVDYNNAPDNDRAWLQEDGENCERHMLRGGTCGNVPGELRSASRVSLFSDFRSSYVGFRVVCRPPPSSTGIGIS